MIRTEIIDDARKLISAGANIEQIMLFLRDSDMNKIASIRALGTLYGTPTADAKTLVDNSKTWSDHFYSDLDLREKARLALIELAVSGDKDLPKIELVGFEDDLL